MSRYENGRQKKWLAKEARFLSLYFPLFPCRLYTVFNLAFDMARFDFFDFVYIGTGVDSDVDSGDFAVISGYAG